MTKEEMKELARRGFEAWEVGIRDLDVTLIDEVYSPDYFNHVWPPETPRGTSRIKESVENLHDVFPDAHYKIDDQLVDGDKVVTRYRATATQQGEWLGVESYDKYGEMNGISIDRIQNGKIIETWYVIDVYGYQNSLRGDAT
jgi:predicted ester cyclase